MAYQVFSTETFDRTLAKVDVGERKRIEGKIRGDFAADPFRNTIQLKGSLSCYRRLRVGDWRIRFTICKVCRTGSCPDSLGCGRCPGRPDDSVLLWTLRLRENAYDD